MAEQKSTGELVKQEQIGALVDQRPDFIETGDRSGTEHLTREDIQMPRIGIAQQMSPELDSTSPKFIEGLRIGNMFNNLTGQVYGDGPLEFSVVRADPPRWVEFNPREAGGGVKDPNVAHDDPRTAFGPNGEHPIATKFYDFIVMIHPTRELVALSFKSTGIKVAKQLNGFIAMRNAPLFAGKYSIVTTMTQNTKGRFAIPVVKNAGWISDKETYAHAKQTFENVRNKSYNIEREGDSSFDTNVMEGELAQEQSGDVGGR